MWLILRVGKVKVAQGEQCDSLWLHCKHWMRSIKNKVPASAAQLWVYFLFSGIVKKLNLILTVIKTSLWFAYACQRFSLSSLFSSVSSCGPKVFRAKMILQSLQQRNELSGNGNVINWKSHTVFNCTNVESMITFRFTSFPQIFIIPP